MVGHTISNYKVIEKIGQGGMGEVNRAGGLKRRKEMEQKRWSWIFIALCLAFVFPSSPVEAQEKSSPSARSSPEDVGMSSE